MHILYRLVDIWCNTTQAVIAIKSNNLFTLAQHTCNYDSLLTGSSNSIFQNISSLSYSNSIDCSFLKNQSFYCVVCCSLDQSVAPDSSVYNLSNTKGTEVTVSLQGLTIGQMYYCKAAATNTNSTRCAGPVVGGVKMYFSFLASLPSTTFPTTCRCIHEHVYSN